MKIIIVLILNNAYQNCWYEIMNTVCKDIQVELFKILLARQTMQTGEMIFFFLLLHYKLKKYKIKILCNLMSYVFLCKTLLHVKMSIYNRLIIIIFGVLYKCYKLIKQLTTVSYIRKCYILIVKTLENSYESWILIFRVPIKLIPCSVQHIWMLILYRVFSVF